MEIFLAALIAVATMLAYAVPGFITVKLGLIKPHSISAFAVILMYVCQPSLTINSLINAEYSWDYFKQVLIFFAVAFMLQILMISIFYFIFKKKGKEDIKYRIATIAVGFGNVGFMGVPLLEAIMPEEVRAQSLMLSVMFLIGLNMIGWTVGLGVITQDKKYFSIKKVILNPAMVGLAIGLPIFFTGATVPAPIADMIFIVGKMSTVISMLIIGMRLATIDIKTMFGDPLLYAVVGVKQIIMPLIGMLIIWFLPLDLFVRQALFILAAAPVASIVLNFSELSGEGQKSAANFVLVGTLFSIVTIPMLSLLMNVLPNIYA